MATVRVLGPGDEEALEAFLISRPYTTMFLRGNLRQAGIVDRGEFMQGTYVAAFEDDAVVAAGSHFWNGNLNLEAAGHVEEVVRTALRASGRGVRGIVAPHAQAVAARRLLGLEDAPTMMDSKEDLFHLELDALRVPTALASGEVSCRRAREDDADVLAPWRVAYDIETLGVPEDQAVKNASRERTRRGVATGNVWVLAKDGGLVSMTAFNATLPDCVQVGGVYTPPELRSRGYARAAVAGSLIDARDEGATRSILFTGEENHPARACYEGLGYERVGDYGLILFRREHVLSL
jgi:predicted GNAT family acetyltransferase